MTDLRVVNGTGQDQPMARPTTLADALRRECEVRGITQNEAAEIIGVTPQSFSKWVRGQVPGNENLRVVAKFLRTPIGQVADMVQSDGVNERLARIETAVERLEKLIVRLLAED